ncbi:MAG: RHS repeat-associated core domain-containing protein [Acidobacteriota bacterium]|nr:MAG: RHS repeat-associated core domain-containing protein [Acidobacteriota bacterium]
MIDRYGNREFDAANTTTLGSCTQAVCNPDINTANNRFSSGQGYSYDQNGNVTQDAEGKRFAYDAENHQKEFFSASNPGTTPDATYHYDGDGRRIKKVTATETTVFVYNASGQLVAEYSTQISQTPQVSYLTTDHLGSPRVVSDQLGAVKDRKDYSAFGEETISAQRQSALGYTAAGDELRKGYTGYEKDNESGLDFAQARYYNSTHGRYTSIDPLTASASIRNPQTFNRYSYVLNSPYKYTDPLGLLPISWNTSFGGGGGFCSASSASCEDGEDLTTSSIEAYRQQQQEEERKRQQDKEKKKQEEKRKKEEERQKKQKQKKPESPPKPRASEEEEVIKVETNINKDLKVISVSSDYIDKDETGQVPVGGRFSITYRFSISTPQDADNLDLSSYGSVESTTSKAFDATENLESVSSKVAVVGTKGSATIIEKTETFRVLADKNSNIRRGEQGTRAINYFVVARNPASAGSGSVRKRSTISNYIEVRVGGRIR